MAFCKECGTPVNGAFCPNCGTPVNAAPANPAPKKSAGGFFSAAGDLGGTTTPRKKAVTDTPAATVAPAPDFTPPVKKPASGSPFMMAGDLLSAAAGGHKETKGSSWDDFLLEKSVTVIGRGSDCDLVVNHPGISSRHATITRKGNDFVLKDCRSDAGTYLNGLRTSCPVHLKENDRISLGSSNFLFSGGRLLYCKTDDPATRATALRSMAPSSRPVVLRTNIQSKWVKNHSGGGMKELIRDINLEVKEGSLVAILGTAGSGKSTVMNCMNGMDLEGVQGHAFYRDVDLIHNFDQMNHLIGSVPQKKVFHDAFTPEEEFMQAAILRLPEDTTDFEIRQRVDKTLELLSMNGVRRNRNSKLSGGEQTRVNLGIELVADRDLLCLDEPDQGLSPNYKHDLFVLLQDLAHKQCKTVITIVHDVSEIDMFDQVIMLAKAKGVGRLAFSGSPAEAKSYFGVEIKDAYALLERTPERFVR